MHDEIATTQENDTPTAPATGATDTATAAPAKRARSAPKATQSARASTKESTVKKSAKSAKKTAAKKSAKSSKKVAAKSAKKANGARSPRGLDATTTPIGDNPFRAGTDRHKQLELARKSKTVGKFVEAGGDRAYLSWFGRSKRVRISAAA